jgi:hypothetical protein
MKQNILIKVGLGFLGILFVSTICLFIIQSQTYMDYSMYQAADQRWSSRTFSKYRLVVQSGLGNCTYDIEVQDEKVLRTYPTDTCPPEWVRYTVSELFDQIRQTNIPPKCIGKQCGCMGHSRIESNYDVSLGYPVTIKFTVTYEWTWVYPQYWIDLVARKLGKFCPPNCGIVCSPIPARVGEELIIKSLEPLP